jgi:excinuclease ABC subunit A
MRVIITGHREEKLQTYELDWIKESINSILKKLNYENGISIAYSGTITEIYDYLRLLYARIGHPHCPNDGTEITKLSVDEIVTNIVNQMEKQLKEDKIKPHQFKLLSPIVRDRKGEFRDLFENVRSKGYSQVRVDGKDYTINDDINLIKTNKHSVDVVIDTVFATFKDLKDPLFITNLRSRLTNDVEQATNLSEGLVILKTEHKEHLYSEKFSCPVCGFSLAEIEPRMFSFNSPLK